MPEKEYTTSQIVFAVLAYSVCSSMMLVTNKLAMSSFPVPAMVTLIQLVTCTAFVYVIGFAGVKTDALTLENAKPYGIYVLAFACGIYSNMRALEGSNVETIIVFRACTPLCVAIIEWAFMNRELPEPKSLASLVVVMMGAGAYVSMDAEFKIGGMAAYFWIFIWYFLLCFQMTFGKYLLKEVSLETVWGPVLYSNFLSIPPTIVLGSTLGDFSKYAPEMVSDSAMFWVSLSCVIGIGIGYTGWACRDMISATSYTLVGVINKLISVAVSVTFINKTASFSSIGCLLVCLLAGTQYKQAPERRAATNDSKGVV
jgi:GDP-mannose transporter